MAGCLLLVAICSRCRLAAADSRTAGGGLDVVAFTLGGGQVDGEFDPRSPDVQSARRVLKIAKAPRP
jgi:hypothetical protein